MKHWLRYLRTCYKVHKALRFYYSLPWYRQTLLDLEYIRYYGMTVRERIALLKTAAKGR